MSIKVPVNDWDWVGGEKAYIVSDWDEKHNPYLVRWATFHLDPESLAGETELEKRVHKAVLGNGERSRFMALTGVASFHLRNELIPQYSFAIPDGEALQVIKRYSPNGVLEIGAGTGYWAKLLTELGADVVAYDSREGKYSFGVELIRGRYHPVIQGTHMDALQKENHGRTLLLVWPDYEGSWADEALRLYRGQVVAYVGEGDGGCTADDAFHRRLYQEFEIVDESRIPQWWGIHDRLYIYRRK